MEQLTLTVHHKGKDYEFPATIHDYGYVVKLQVEIEGSEVMFEPDEERNWRALISFEDVEANKKPDADLLQAIAKTISGITK